MAYARVDSARLSYATAGQDGPPVVLIMGLGLTGAAWARQVRALSTHHRVLVFDHRGIGGSEAATRLVSIPRMAADTAALMDHLGWSSAHVVGISMGGAVAQELALAHRRRVRSLTLLATVAGGGLGWLPSPAGMWWLTGVFLARGKWFYRALARQLFARPYLEGVDTAALLAQMQSLLGPRPSYRATFAQLAALLVYRSRRRLPRLAGLPTLIVHGGRDVIVRPRQGAKLEALIPGARRVVFPESGHGLLVQEADRLNALLLEHFAGAEAQERPGGA